MADASSVEIGNYPFQNITNTVGYILFGIYNWLTVLVLINVLIAMMARSYEVIVVRYTDICMYLFQSN